MRKDARIEQLTLQLEHEKEKRREMEFVQRFVAVGLRTLSLRMLTAGVLVADCLLCAWALWVGTWQSLLAALLFSVVSWAVLYLRPPNVKEQGNEEGVVP